MMAARIDFDARNKPNDSLQLQLCSALKSLMLAAANDCFEPKLPILRNVANGGFKKNG